MIARHWIKYVLAFIKLGRFLFLAGGFALYGLGVAIASYSGATINWTAAIWGQIIVTATQLMVHYSNDYFDYEVDQNNLTPTAWSGGSRILQTGEIPPRLALIAAICLGLIAVIGALLLALIEHPGVLAVPIVLVAVALAWEYSAPPLSLHARGIGELCAVFIVSMLTPIFGYYLQTGYISATPLLAIVPICCLQFNMLLSVDIPDLEGDAAVNKRTLVVRLGRPATARFYLIELVAAYVLIWLVVLLGVPILVAAAFSLNSPLAFWLAWRMLKGDWSRSTHWGRLAFFSVALLMSATILELIAFLLLPAIR